MSPSMVLAVNTPLSPLLFVRPASHKWQTHTHSERDFSSPHFAFIPYLFHLRNALFRRRWLFSIKILRIGFYSLHFLSFLVRFYLLLMPSRVVLPRAGSESDDTISCIRKFYLMIINVSLNSKNDVRKIKEFLNRASFSFLINIAHSLSRLCSLTMSSSSSCQNGNWEWAWDSLLLLTMIALHGGVRKKWKKKISANLRIVILIRFSPFIHTYLSLIRYWIIISCTHHMKLQRNSWVETCLSTIFRLF